MKAIEDLGFESPTEIQRQAIPKLLSDHRDFIGLAQTGTGKTAAFGLPLLEHIDTENEQTQALILAPTRELGQQIAEQIAFFSKHMERVSVLAVYGGAAISHQIKALKKPQHIIIATPGRLIDLMKRKAVKLQALKFLVLDEADEMLNMGFKEELDEILRYTPEEKLTWLFSATMPKEIKRIIKNYMENPFEVRVNLKNEVNANIVHQYVMVKREHKLMALTRFLEVDTEMRCLVFCRTKMDTQNLSDELQRRNYKVDAIHGDLSQAQRDRVMKKFKSHNLEILIATDVAARGIDVNDLTHVFHYTIPDDAAYYTHRSGRTARAGKKGTSVIFIAGSEGYRIRRLERELDISFQKVLVPETEDVAVKRIRAWCLEVLEARTKGKIDETFLEMAYTLFGNLSKEELIDKILLRQIETIEMDAAGDLNDEEVEGRSRGSDRRRNRSRGGRGSGKKAHRKGQGKNRMRGPEKERRKKKSAKRKGH